MLKSQYLTATGCMVELDIASTSITFLVYGQEQTHAQIAVDAKILSDKIISKNYSDDDRKKLKDIANLIQNTGQSIGETYKDNKKALQYTDSAIFLFNILGDTLSEANNRKFKGYLLGTIGKFF